MQEIQCKFADFIFRDTFHEPHDQVNYHWILDFALISVEEGLDDV
jgi:hypothetical protein